MASFQTLRNLALLTKVIAVNIHLVSKVLKDMIFGICIYVCGGYGYG